MLYRPICWQHDMNIQHLVSSAFTSRQTSLLVLNKNSVFLYDIYVFSQYTYIISIGQKLVCPIQFQAFLVLLDPPNGVFQSKAEKQRR
jgi:uncharacterized protein YbbC (DUF1343 family)